VEEKGFEEVLEVPLATPLPVNAQEALYHFAIPVGGELLGENGEMRTLPMLTFHIDLKPSYLGQLTFVRNKKAPIEDKTVTFKGLEINPTSAVVYLCILDPAGKQWLPTAYVLSKGDIFTASYISLISGEPDQEMCYKIFYTSPFHFDMQTDPRSNLFIMLSKLTKDQPERLPYELIASAQNQLAEKGIVFNYVIVNHGSRIDITKKPLGMSESEALALVQEALTEQATSSDVLIFDLKE